MCPLEQAIVAGLLQAVRAGTLDLPDPSRKVVDAVDAIEDDRPVADRGADQLEPPLDEQIEQVAERVTFEVTGQHLR